VSRPSSGHHRNTADFGLLALGGAFGAAALAWAGGVTAIRLSGGRPRGSISAGVAAFAHPGDPGLAWPHAAGVPPPWLYWPVVALVVAVAATFALTGRRLFDSHEASSATRSVRNLPGMASRAELIAAAGKKALMRRAPVIRPSQTGRGNPGQVGYRIGTSRGAELWFAIEDSALLVGPPRSGKGVHCVIPWILDAPGAVVTTSTRPDNLAVTMNARAKRGPLAIFDPQRLAGLPDGLRWSPVRGCERPHTAMARARGLGAGAGWSGGGVSDGRFWAGQTETVLRCLLHAAALDGRNAADLYRWSLSPAAAMEAVGVLDNTDGAAPGWAIALGAIIDSAPRSRDSIWLGVRQSLASLADPDVLAAVTPEVGETFDPEAFLRDAGTLYLLGSSVGAASCASLIASFVEDITETARALAARAPHGRLDPPLLLALDEIANLTPLPSLPNLMAEGGGRGVTTLVVLQSLAQAREKWGEHAADAIWDASTVKLILGGLGKVRDLDDLSRLLGERDESTTSVSRGGRSGPSTSTSLRRVPVMPPELLRTLPDGLGTLLLRRTKPAVVDLTHWHQRDDAVQLRSDQQAFDTASQQAALAAAAARDKVGSIDA
jgi:type IV secretory pathway TraG/TraD family ATPase VirD4